MLAYITATTLVKGVQNKNVYYIGDVQDDGYIYFNDDVSYRIPKPSNMTEHVSVNAANVQIWYTLRNCWIRANRFTNLQVYGVEPKNIYSRIDSLETRMSNLEERVGNLEQRMTAVENRVATVEGELSTLNSHLGTFYRDIVLANGFNTLSEYLIDWRSEYDVVEGYLGQFWNALNLYSYDDAGNTINYSNMREWMDAVKSMLRLSYTREKTNADNIYTLGNTVASHTQSIAALYQADTALSNRITANTNNISSLTNTVTSHGNRIAALEVTSAQHTNTLTNYGNRISSLEARLDDAYTSGGQTYDLYDAFDKIFNDSAALGAKISGANIKINELGHKALGQSYQGTDGNGVTLLNVYNKMNDVIGVVNTLSSGGTVIGTIPSLPNTSLFTGWTDIFPV